MKPSINKEQKIPLIIRGDISSLHIDTIVCGMGCFLQTGFLGASLKKLYGKDLYDFLKKKFFVSQKPAHLPRKYNAKPEDFADIRKLGGLPQGFTALIDKNELCQLKDINKDAPSMLIAIIGGEYISHINPTSIKQLIYNAFETLGQHYKNEQKKILVGFPAFGTGRARLERLEAIEVQIKALMEGHERYKHIIPVFVCYTDPIHHIALNIRTKLAKSDNFSYLVKFRMEKSIVKLKKELESERLVIFTGAGISQSSGLPSWKNLVFELAKQANVPMDSEVNDSQYFLEIAEKCRQHLGEQFIPTMQNLLKTKSGGNGIPSLTHYFLATLPISTIVTTNFDDLLEQALIRIKKATFTINNAFDVARSPINQINVLKIHGDIENLHDVTFGKEDYNNYFQKRPAISALLRGLLLNRTFLFVGYSLRDPNLHIILDEVAGLLKNAQRPIYAIVFEATEEEIQFCSDKGIEVLVLAGNDSWEKSLSLWYLLDTLKCHHYKTSNLWLAEEAPEFFPQKNPKWQKYIDNLRETLNSFAQEIEEEKDLPEEIIDFLFPWFSLAMEQGLGMSCDFWEKIAKHYRNKEFPTEASKLKSLAAEIAAFRTSDGRRQMKHELRIWQMRKDWHKD